MDDEKVSALRQGIASLLSRWETAPVEDEEEKAPTGYFLQTPSPQANELSNTPPNTPSGRLHGLSKTLRYMKEVLRDKEIPDLDSGDQPPAAPTPPDEAPVHKAYPFDKPLSTSFGGVPGQYYGEALQQMANNRYVSADLEFAKKQYQAATTLMEALLRTATRTQESGRSTSTWGVSEDRSLKTRMELERLKGVNPLQLQKELAANEVAIMDSKGVLRVYRTKPGITEKEMVALRDIASLGPELQGIAEEVEKYPNARTVDSTTREALASAAGAVINRALGQGAMTDAEAKRYMQQLTPDLIFSGGGKKTLLALASMFNQLASRRVASYGGSEVGTKAWGGR